MEWLNNNSWIINYEAMKWSSMAMSLRSWLKRFNRSSLASLMNQTCGLFLLVIKIAYKHVRCCNSTGNLTRSKAIQRDDDGLSNRFRSFSAFCGEETILLSFQKFLESRRKHFWIKHTVGHVLEKSEIIHRLFFWGFEFPVSDMSVRLSGRWARRCMASEPTE